MARYYKTCPRCGANLDPGERCDCDAVIAGEAYEVCVMGTQTQT